MEPSGLAPRFGTCHDSELIGTMGIISMVGGSEDPMLVTMKNSELIDKLVVIADGNIDLVHEAIRVCAEGSDSANLKKVVEYIVTARQRQREPEAA